MTTPLFLRLLEALRYLTRFPDLLMILPRVQRRAEVVLGEAVRLEALPGRGAWATFLLEGAGGPRAVLRVVSTRRGRLAARVNDPNPYYANETPRERWARECGIHKALGPLGLAPPLLDAGEGYLLMDYLSGPTLTEWKVAPQEELVAIIGLVMESLYRLHEMGFIHGDARPDNIVVAEGSIVFIDFEHLIDPGRPVSERQALDWLRFFHHLHNFRPDLLEGEPDVLLKQIHQLVDTETLRQFLLLADRVQYAVPLVLLKSLEELAA